MVHGKTLSQGPSMQELLLAKEMDNDTAAVLYELLRELSSELDLHYEDNQLPVARPTLEIIERGRRALKEAEKPVPSVVDHILKRARKSLH